MEKVVLGLSGGVDSAVAASLLKKAGYEVFGLYLDIDIGSREDAEKTAESLNIPLRVLNISAALETQVCARFAESYLCGRTPNPCIMCNPAVKFPALINYADELGASFVATGHYARCVDGRLLKGPAANDQSYMLSRLTKAQLSRCIFPLGDYSQKAEIRGIADSLSLPVADKPDSMEICFVPDGDYAAFIEARGIIPPKGDFIDDSGRVLGQHKGIHRYTVGQRKRLGIALGKRVFVSAIDPVQNTVTLSDDEDVFASSISASDANWLIVPPENGFDCEVRVRHSRQSYAARVTPRGDGFIVDFKAPVRAPTPGQAAVCYIGDEVVCSGYID